MNVEILPYKDSHREAVQELITEIQQQEFRLSVELTDQPDLLDIERSYKRYCGNFWVALDGTRVVGTVGLLDIGNRQFALRKMFVHRDYRGKDKGVAGALLHAAQKWAAGVGYNSILLGTTDRFHAAHRFYEKNGFSLIDSHALPPSFPRMAVDTVFYAKRLS